MKLAGPHRFHAAFRLTNAATFLFNSSSALFLLFPVYLLQLGGSPAQIGLVVGLLRAGSLVARPVGGRLLDRVGRRWVTGAGALLALLGTLSLFAFPRFGVIFFLWRVLQGMGTSCIDSGLGAVVADLSPPEARARVYAIYTVWINLASTFIPGLGEALVRRAGFFPLFGVAALALAACFLLVLQLPETARPRAERPISLQGVPTGSGPLLLGTLLLGWEFGTLSTFVPVARIAAAPGRVGLFFFAYYLGLIVVRLAGGLGVSRLVQPGMLLPAYGVLAAGLAALPFGHGALRLALVALACGAAHGAAIPVLYASLLIGLPRDRRGWAVALYSAASDLGVVLATVGLGAVGEWIGYRGIFGVAAAVMALGAGAAHLWGRRLGDSG
jgi:MFS family permease